MDTKSFIDDLLRSSSALTEKGKSIAEDKLQISPEGVERDAQMDGMKKGAVAAGVLALLLGTKSGRKLSGSALKIGGLAAIGGIGYKAYKHWAAEKDVTEKEYKGMAEDIGRDNADTGTLINFDEMNDKETESRSQVLLKAMIAAAKADGHVDSKEVDAIEKEVPKLGLGDGTAVLIQEEISKPLDVKEIAALATDQAMAAEIYLLSTVIIDKENKMEYEYLEQLAKEMHLPDALVEQLEEEVKK